MKIAVLYYDGFSEFEVVLVCLFFKEHDLITVALEEREYLSEERQRFRPDRALRDVDPSALDLLVIPGGEPAPLAGNAELRRFVEQALASKGIVAGICGGAALLGGLGVLQGRRCTGLASGRDPRVPSYRYFTDATFVDEQVVVDGRIVTAQGQAYVEFAVELARRLGLCAKEEEYQQALAWFRNIRRP